MARLRRLGALLGVAALFAAPQAVSQARFSDRITRDPAALRPAPAVLFGAAVYPDGALSEISAERVAAAALLYRAGVSDRILVSGTGRANREVERLTDALVAAGVPAEAVSQDPWGIDSDDTCRHVAALGWSAAVLVSQGFHLPRILQMCEDKNIEVQGFDARAMSVGSTSPWTTVARIRSGRLLREGALSWLYGVGLYAVISREAEEAGR